MERLSQRIALLGAKVVIVSTTKDGGIECLTTMGNQSMIMCIKIRNFGGDSAIRDERGY